MASNRWDALLTGSTWYVPAANLLAYRLDSTNPTTPIPAADQTIWSIGTAEGGRFSGQSVAKIVDATGAVTTSLATMDGRVTERGQVRITFTTPIGSTITGIGQVRRVNGAQAMEMQMITGGGPLQAAPHRGHHSPGRAGDLSLGPLSMAAGHKLEDRAPGAQACPRPLHDQRLPQRLLLGSRS